MRYRNDQAFFTRIQTRLPLSPHRSAASGLASVPTRPLNPPPRCAPGSRVPPAATQPAATSRDATHSPASRRAPWLTLRILPVRPIGQLAMKKGGPSDEEPPCAQDAACVTRPWSWPRTAAEPSSPWASRSWCRQPQRCRSNPRARRPRPRRRRSGGSPCR